MTWKRLGLNFLGLAVIVTGISVFGPMLSRKLDADYRKEIDKNGILVPGVITKKIQRKGRGIHFRYQYKGKSFSNSETGRFYYKLEIGDSVWLKADSSRPKNSYILNKLRF